MHGAPYRHTVVSEGNCMNVKVAKGSLSEEEIVENVLAVVAALGDVVPRKFKNVQALYLKTGESVALPLYAALPDDGHKIEDVAKPVKSK
jgi:ribosome biogenesis protein UTP30